MNSETIRVLLVEDNPGDVRLIREMLAEAGETRTELECVGRLDAALKRLSAGGIDVLLLDLSLPDGQGIEVCARAHTQAPQVPIVVLTGLDDETKAIKTLRTGAQDYLVKGQVDSRLLVRSIRYAIERQRVEEALRESEEKYRSLFDNMLEGFAYCQIIVDENKRPVDFVYLTVNGAFERLTGLKKKDVTGKKVTEVIPGIRDSKTDFFDIYGRVALAGEEARFEAYFEPLEKWLTISAYSPKKGYFVAVFDDVTKRKVTEARSIQLQKDLNLASRLASLGEMAAGIAHEINNPLSGVIGFSEMLMEKDVPQDIAQDLKVINENAQRVAAIVRNMLTFARPRGEGKQYADINSIISRVLEAQSYELKTGNIQVTTELSPELPWTLVDEGQIQQVLLNIITNAEQAIRRRNVKGRLSVTSQNQGDKIQVTIADNGKGIAAENLEKIFEPFFTTKEPGEGTGLGLSISYSIIREHDGRLYARSKPGHGTTFVIELPIVSEPQQLKLAESSLAEPRGANGGKILVVDDEPDICRLISRLLGKDGYKVETTLNARQALERLATERYRLILVDIKMPDINGMEFYRRVGRIARSIQKRIVFITGDTISTETGAFLQKTGATYINKPFGIKEFNQTVNKRLAESL